MLGNLRAPEIILILAILVLLFGATKLPALAQSVGKSLKIFKKEVQPDADRTVADSVVVDSAPTVNDSELSAPTDAKPMS